MRIRKKRQAAKIIAVAFATAALSAPTAAQARALDMTGDEARAVHQLSLDAGVRAFSPDDRALSFASQPAPARIVSDGGSSLDWSDTRVMVGVSLTTALLLGSLLLARGARRSGVAAA